MTGHVGGTGFAATTGCRRTAATTGRSADDVPTDRHRTTTAGHAPARTVAGSTWRPGRSPGSGRGRRMTATAGPLPPTRRFLMVHGVQHRRPRQHWLWWLTEELRGRGEQVLYPQFPAPDQPSVDEWTALLHAELAQLGDRERVVVCHSLGCALWLRAAQDLPKELRVSRVLLVSPLGDHAFTAAHGNEEFRTEHVDRALLAAASAQAPRGRLGDRSLRARRATRVERLTGPGLRHPLRRGPHHPGGRLRPLAGRARMVPARPAPGTGRHPALSARRPARAGTACVPDRVRRPRHPPARPGSVPGSPAPRAGRPRSWSGGRAAPPARASRSARVGRQRHLRDRVSGRLGPPRSLGDPGHRRRILPPAPAFCLLPSAFCPAASAAAPRAGCTAPRSAADPARRAASDASTQTANERSTCCTAPSTVVEVERSALQLCPEPRPRRRNAVTPVMAPCHRSTLPSTRVLDGHHPLLSAARPSRGLRSDGTGG